jgi:hypothetical protein
VARVKSRQRRLAKRPGARNRWLQRSARRALVR